VVIILALLFQFGVGFSLVGLAEERITSDTPASTPAAELSKDKTRKTSSLAGSCDDLGVLVDRSHPLPTDYAPQDLVPLQDYGVPALGKEELLRRQAAVHLGDLVEEASADGEELVVASAYRSYEEQRLAHERLLSVLGEGASSTSAAPGHSQHQLGTAVDLTNAEAGYLIWEPFGRTSAYRWLEEHAFEYGYVLAYPRGEEHRSGYRWEPWHYRYVGVDTARRLKMGNLSLQGYLERAGTIPRC
jgi:D-alanyl-D-alanine carboxypeptidase